MNMEIQDKDGALTLVITVPVQKAQEGQEFGFGISYHELLNSKGMRPVPIPGSGGDGFLVAMGYTKKGQPTKEGLTVFYKKNLNERQQGTFNPPAKTTTKAGF
jgi:hypothetical protein